MLSYTSGMSIEQQIGQLFIVGFWGTTPSEEIIDLIKNYHVGGVLIYSRNVVNPQQVQELTSNLQMIAREAGHRYPLFIGLDQENGMVQRLGPGTTIFPGSMSLGAAGSEQLANEIALAAGREIKALGINLNFAPVADVNNNPANPVIGVRSFGENPQEVARLVSAMVKGYNSAGVMTMLKHFPGHGDTAVDTHLALSVIPYKMDRLEKVELVPFESGIRAGANMVMVAHIYFPSIMPGAPSPASVSPEIIRGLLREKLGFEGVIISDCMEMKAISETIGAQHSAVLTLQAGSDLILVSHLYTRQRWCVKSVQTAVASHELSTERITEAAENIIRLKRHYLS